MTLQVSQRVTRTLSSIEPLLKFQAEPRWARLLADPESSNFIFGNPQEMPLVGFVEAIRRLSVPQNKDWFAYKMSLPEAQQAVAAGLRERRGIAFEPDDICMTNGAFAGISIALAAITDPGDEVIYISPPWFFYESLIAAHSATPVRVKILPETFDLDLEAIAAAITPRTRAILVNSPHNPTGRIYPAGLLRALAELLAKASQRNGRAIYLLSDEAYYRIIFDGRAYYSPTEHYANTFLIYTYGKTLLTPGARMGYIALPPAMPDREQMRSAILAAQVLTGYGFPNAVLQYAAPELENISIDVAALQRRRDRLVDALRGMGYTPTVPEGTFYVLVRSPIEDDMAFVERLADEKVLCLPGAIFEAPGYFRISLTANDGMVERALPGFARALAKTARAAGVSTKPQHARAG
jgi:aspartate aminotransferase